MREQTEGVEAQLSLGCFGATCESEKVRGGGAGYGLPQAEIRRVEWRLRAL